MTSPHPRGSFWPTPTQEALLRIAVGAQERSVARWRQLQPVDVTALETGSFCLLPLLHERLAQLDEKDHQLSLLLGTYRSTWYRNQLLLERLSGFIPELVRHAVEPIVVGGAALASRWYGRIGTRPVVQLELIVDPGAGLRAREALIAAEWRPAGRSGTFGRFVDAASGTLVVHDGAPLALAGPLGLIGGYAVLRDAAETRDVGAVQALTLQPADELLYCVALGARTTTPPTVQWLVDVVQILTSPERPDPGEIACRAELFRVVKPLRDTLAYLMRRIDVAGLDDYAYALAALRVPARDRIAYRLAGSQIGLAGGLPLTLSAHLRATAQEPWWRVAITLPGHLQRAWETRRVRDLPKEAWKRASRVARPRRSAARG